MLPEVGQCFYPPAPPSPLLSRHFSAAISQLGESREGRSEALPCLPLRVCAHMQTGQKKRGGEKNCKSRRETPDSDVSLGEEGCPPPSNLLNVIHLSVKSEKTSAVERMEKVKSVKKKGKKDAVIG